MIKRFNRGVTLLEILVSVAVMAVGLAVILQIFPMGFAASQKGTSKAMAYELAARKLEEVKANYLFGGIPADYSNESQRKKRYMYWGEPWAPDPDSYGVANDPTAYTDPGWVEVNTHTFFRPFESGRGSDSEIVGQEERFFYRVQCVPVIDAKRKYMEYCFVEGNQFLGYTSVPTASEYSRDDADSWRGFPTMYRINVCVRGPLAKAEQAQDDQFTRYNSSAVEVNLSTMYANKGLADCLLGEDLPCLNYVGYWPDLYLLACKKYSIQNCTGNGDGLNTSYYDNALHWQICPRSNFLYIMGFDSTVNTSSYPTKVTKVGYPFPEDFTVFNVYNLSCYDPLLYSGGTSTTDLYSSRLSPNDTISIETEELTLTLCTDTTKDLLKSDKKSFNVSFLNELNDTGPSIPINPDDETYGFYLDRANGFWNWVCQTSSDNIKDFALYYGAVKDDGYGAVIKADGSLETANPDKFRTLKSIHPTYIASGVFAHWVDYLDTDLSASDKNSTLTTIYTKQCLQNPHPGSWSGPGLNQLGLDNVCIFKQCSDTYDTTNKSYIAETNKVIAIHAPKSGPNNSETMWMIELLNPVVGIDNDSSYRTNMFRSNNTHLCVTSIMDNTYDGFAIIPESAADFNYSKPKDGIANCANGNPVSSGKNTRTNACTFYKTGTSDGAGTRFSLDNFHDRIGTHCYTGYEKGYVENGIVKGTRVRFYMRGDVQG